MKQTGMLIAAICAAVAVAVPDWKGTLHAETGAYGTVLYKIPGASLVQKLKVAGCKTLTSSATTNVEFYDDDTYYYGAADGTPVRGTWALANGIFYLSVSEAAEGNLFDAYNAAATTQCKVKYPAMAGVEIIEPSAVTTKNFIKVKANDSVKGQYVMKGQQVNDAKGTDKVGTFSVKTKLTGTVVEVAP